MGKPDTRKKGDKTGQVNIRLSEEMEARVTAVAKRFGMSKAAVMLELAKYYLAPWEQAAAAKEQALSEQIANIRHNVELV